VPKELQGR
jgi:hypothetical protein